MRTCWEGFLPQPDPLPVLVAVLVWGQAPVGFGVASIPSLASSSPARTASSQPRPVASQVLTAANKWCVSDVSRSQNTGEDWSSVGPAEHVLTLSPPPHQSHRPSFWPTADGHRLVALLVPGCMRRKWSRKHKLARSPEQLPASRPFSFRCSAHWLGCPLDQTCSVGSQVKNPLKCMV